VNKRDRFDVVAASPGWCAVDLALGRSVASGRRTCVAPGRPSVHRLPAGGANRPTTWSCAR